MNVMNPNKVALLTGTILSGWHLIWALLVLTGLAQTIFDFILWAHMIHLSITIGPFDAMAALALVVITFIIGYAIGFSIALVWNRLHQLKG